MGSVIGRVIGGLIGLLLIAGGTVLLMEGTGVRASGASEAIALAVVALGIGLLGASVLPGQLEVNGKQVDPIGIGVQATGGAALFIVTLLFMLNMPGLGPEPARPDPPPQQVQTQPVQTTPQPVQTTVTPAQVQPQQVFYAYTFCDQCCANYAPGLCPYVGYGESTDLAVAQQNAITNCARAGGNYARCEANVQRVFP